MKRHAELYAALHPHERDGEQDRPPKPKTSRREAAAR